MKPTRDIPPNPPSPASPLFPSHPGREPPNQGQMCGSWGGSPRRSRSQETPSNLPPTIFSSQPGPLGPPKSLPHNQAPFHGWLHKGRALRHGSAGASPVSLSQSADLYLFTPRLSMSACITLRDVCVSLSQLRKEYIPLEGKGSTGRRQLVPDDAWPTSIDDVKRRRGGCLPQQSSLPFDSNKVIPFPMSCDPVECSCRDPNSLENRKVEHDHSLG
ncbi:unnamed protein product [Boreogadus saida]